MISQALSPRLVLFDLDGTVLSGSSSESAFLRFLFRRGYLGYRQWLAAAIFMLRWFWVYGIFAPIKNKAYLADLRVEEIERLAAEFVETTLLARIRFSLRQRIAAHEARGDILVLLTGAFDFLARPIAADLGIPHCEATVLSTEDGRFTGRPPLQHPFSREKYRIASRLGDRFHRSFGEMVAYGNSANDIPLLSRVGTPIAVAPSLILWAVAKIRRWEII